MLVLAGTVGLPPAVLEYFDTVMYSKILWDTCASDAVPEIWGDPHRPNRLGLRFSTRRSLAVLCKGTGATQMDFLSTKNKPILPGFTTFDIPSQLQLGVASTPTSFLSAKNTQLMPGGTEFGLSDKLQLSVGSSTPNFLMPTNPLLLSGGTEFSLSDKLQPSAGLNTANFLSPKNAPLLSERAEISTVGKPQLGVHASPPANKQHPSDPAIGSAEFRSRLAKKAADARHSKPGGSRDKAKKIRTIWASGKYTAREICAEQECAALEMSFSAARKALRKTPAPSQRS